MQTSFAHALLALAIAAPCSLASTIYVSPQGDDASPGTREQPLQTISAAAERAEPGDVVYVLEGTYRERVAPARGGEPGKPITYRAERGKRVFVKGSEIWTPEWKSEGDGVYSAQPDEALFDDRSSEYVDHHNPFKVELASTPWARQGRREEERRLAGDDRIRRADPRIAYTCGQIFVNGEQYLEVPLKDELKAGSWWYDADADRVWIDFGDLSPREQELEITTRRRIFAPAKRGLGHIVVEGFIFEHCGNQYPTNFWEIDAYAQKGAVGTEAGHHWVIRRNVIRHVKTFAIDVGRVDRHSNSSMAHDNLVEENYILENGSAGILSNGSNRLVIRKNVILRNNTLRFFGIKRWEQAGIKMHQFRDGLIEQNYVANNYAMSGIWLDNQFPDSRVSRNISYGNGTRGIFLEMSDYDFDRLLVDNNLFLGNRENAVYIHDASGATFVNNLLANTTDTPGRGQAIHILQVGPRTKTYHHSFYGNMLIGNPRNVDVNYPAARSGPQRFDFNLYSISPDARAFVVNSKSDKPSPWKPNEFRELILGDLDLDKEPAGMMDREGQAALSATEWQAFWQRHQVVNDANSAFDPESSVRYHPDTQKLTIELQIDPNSIGRIDHPAARSDFYGQERGTTASSAPGPFQDLHRGSNEFDVWAGLPILQDRQLPAPEWNE